MKTKRILSYGVGLSRQNPLHQFRSTSTSRTILSPEELSEIHSLTIRLCDANRLHDAVRLLDASLLALPSPSSLPIPILVDRLSSAPSLSRQYPLHQFRSSSSSSSLSPEELSEIHSLTIRLCDANRLHDAVRLLDASLLALPSPSSLPIPILVDRLSSAPSLSHSMSLLTSLRHNPNALPSALPFCSALLLSSYLRKRRFADAGKVFSWFLRGEDSPCRPDQEMYRLALRGFCAGGRPAEGVRAAREMVRDGLGIGGEDERGWLRRSLLREARVDEALELDAAALAGDTEELGRLLDRIIWDWQD